MFAKDRVKVFPTRVSICLFFLELECGPVRSFLRLEIVGSVHWGNHSRNLLSLFAGCGEVRAVITLRNGQLWDSGE